MLEKATVCVVRHWKRLPRNLQIPSLEMFKAGLDGALSNMVDELDGLSSPFQHSESPCQERKKWRKLRVTLTKIIILPGASSKGKQCGMMFVSFTVAQMALNGVSGTRQSFINSPLLFILKALG